MLVGINAAAKFIYGMRSGKSCAFCNGRTACLKVLKGGVDPMHRNDAAP